MKKITIIAGHFGCGKTNIAVNHALELAESGKKVSVVDLDIINPFFRAADNEKLLTSKGIDSILPEYANTNVDLPTLPPRFKSIFVSDAYAIIDVGGDDSGATVLSGYKKDIAESGYEMYYVYSMYRPTVKNPADALFMLKAIEHSSKLRFDGIINNSNLGAETASEDIIASIPSALELAALAKLPLTATSALTKFKPELEEYGQKSGYNFIYIDDITKKLF